MSTVETGPPGVRNREPAGPGTFPPVPQHGRATLREMNFLSPLLPVNLSASSSEWVLLGSGERMYLVTIPELQELACPAELMGPQPLGEGIGTGGGGREGSLFLSPALSV